MLGPQLLMMDIRLIVMNLLTPCCGARVRSGINDANNHIDRLEHLFYDMRETSKEYDLSQVNKIKTLEADV